MKKDNKNSNEKRNKELDLFLKNTKKSHKSNQPGMIFWIIVFTVGWVLLSAFFDGNYFSNTQEKPFNEFVKQAKEGNILNLNVTAEEIKIKLVNGEEFLVKKEASSTIDDILKNNGIEMSQIKGD